MKIINFFKNRRSWGKINLAFASLFFSLMTVCVKKVDDSIPIYELVFFRSLFSLTITSYIIRQKNINPWGNKRFLLILRGVLGTIALLCIFYAIKSMPLNIATVIQYTYPIFISVFAGIVIKEKVTKRALVSLIIGWFGILIILNPNQLSNLNVNLDRFSIFIAFLGSISTSLAYVTVKKLSSTEDIYIIIKYFPLISVIFLFPVVVINWVTPELHDFVWISGIGIFTQLGQTFLTIGLKKLPASEASTINYLQVLFGSTWGIIFFSEFINIKFIFCSLLVLLGTIISSSKMQKNI